MTITDYLESKEIEPHYPGEKNVTRGWVNIHCPFPDCDDPSWHCGINLATLMFNCYICGARGHVTKLVKQIEDCSWQRAEIVANTLQDDSFEEPKRDVRTGREDMALPKEARDEMPDIHRNYLIDRRFDPDELTEKYQLKFCYNIGDWRFRIIVPISMDGNLVCFTSLDVTGKAQIKYRHCPNDEAVVPAKECLYNIDSVKDVAIVEEGVTDVWRTGDGAVGTFGVQYTREQLVLLYEKRLRKAVVAYDADAYRQGAKLAYQLSGFTRAEYYQLSRGDPDDLSDREIEDLRKEIFR